MVNERLPTPVKTSLLPLEYAIDPKLTVAQQYSYVNVPW